MEEKTLRPSRRLQMDADDDRITGFSGSSRAVRRIKPKADASAGRGLPFCQDRIRALGDAQARLHKDIARALNNARLPVLEQITKTVKISQSHPASAHEMPAIMLQLGPAAVSGDRSQTVDAVLDAICFACNDGMLEVVRLQSELHSSFNSALRIVDKALAVPSAADCGSLTLIVFEDADRFPAETLRDIVYVCGSYSVKASGMVSAEHASRRRTSFIFGVTISPHTIISALGAGEATMIAPLYVSMPSIEHCFHAVVREVLCDERHCIILASDVFARLREEFFQSGASIALLERALDDIYAIQFMEYSLLPLISNPDVTPPCLLNGLRGSAQEPCREADNDDMHDNMHVDMDRSNDVQIVKQDFFIRMSRAHARDIVCAQNMQSVSNNLPDEMLAMYDSITQATSDKAGDSFNDGQVERPADLTDTDVARVKELVFTWYKQYVEWRWLAKVVERTVWTLIENLEFTDAEFSEIISGRYPESTLFLKQVRSLLYEELLPEYIPCVGKELPHNRISRDTSKTLLVGVRQKLQAASISQLETLIPIWIECMSSSATAAGAPVNASLWSCIAHLESLRARVIAYVDCTTSASATSAKGSQHPERQEAAKKELQDTGAQDSCRAGRSRFDDAVHEAEIGSSRGQKRAAGGAAARHKRLKAYQEAGHQGFSQERIGMLRQQAFHIFNAMLDLITPLQSLALHDIVVFKHLSKLQSFSSFMSGAPEPRSSFIRAMRAPYLEHGQLSAAETPDISEAYKILADSGRMVNLSDWYHAFASVRLSADITKLAEVNDHASSENVTDDERKHSAPKSMPRCQRSEITSQAEFARAVPTLEFLGVLKHTNRKTDHVARLFYE